VLDQWLGHICEVAIFLICILANRKVKKKIKNMASCYTESSVLTNCPTFLILTVTQHDELSLKEHLSD
jgi:hypothetical protein